MKNKIKKISMVLCASMIIFGSVNTTATEADAWSLFKTKKEPYRNTTITTKYVGDADFDNLANVANEAVKKMAKNNKKIGKSSLKNIFSSIFKGGKNKGFLKTYLKSNLNNAKETENVLKEMNKELKKVKAVYSNW